MRRLLLAGVLLSLLGMRASAAVLVYKLTSIAKDKSSFQIEATGSNQHSYFVYDTLTTNAQSVWWMENKVCGVKAVTNLHAFTIRAPHIGLGFPHYGIFDDRESEVITSMNSGVDDEGNYAQSYFELRGHKEFIPLPGWGDYIPLSIRTNPPPPPLIWTNLALGHFQVTVPITNSFLLITNSFWQITNTYSPTSGFTFQIFDTKTINIELQTVRDLLEGISFAYTYWAPPALASPYTNLVPLGILTITNIHRLPPIGSGIFFPRTLTGMAHDYAQTTNGTVATESNYSLVLLSPITSYAKTNHLTLDQTADYLLNRLLTNGCTLSVTNAP